MCFFLFPLTWLLCSILYRLFLSYLPRFLLLTSRRHGGSALTLGTQHISGSGLQVLKWKPSDGTRFMLFDGGFPRLIPVSVTSHVCSVNCCVKVNSVWMCSHDHTGKPDKRSCSALFYRAKNWILGTAEQSKRTPNTSPWTPRIRALLICSVLFCNSLLKSRRLQTMKETIFFF